MLRRILSNVIENPAAVAQDPMIYHSPFTKLDTLPFGWLATMAPSFPLKSSSIRILEEPREFYDAIRAGCRSAKNRLIIASLYLGNGQFERTLVKSLMNNENFQNGNLKVRVLLDYTRGSRLQDNSRSMLQPLLQSCDKHQNCEVSLYHTPVLRGLIKKIMPNRWNELLGLQHMKLYIFDNTLVISGANLSRDYFTNRQDRYFVIEDKRLCDFYTGLVARVQKFSLKMDKNNDVHLSEEWQHCPYEGDKKKFVDKAGDMVDKYLMENLVERNVHKEVGYDTWVFPLVQMGQLGIDQDSNVTQRIFSESPPDSTLCIATGYFNLPRAYKNTLIANCRARCKILMAHPRTNGFLGARGPAGGIPFAYSLIADQFKNEFDRCGRARNRIKLYEYFRETWTYHGKGLWYYPPNGQYPCLTLIGSPNFGERSLKRDLETQLALVTENEELRKKLHEECQRLYSFGLPADTQRKVPKWVHAIVLFFRDYF